MDGGRFYRHLYADDEAAGSSIQISSIRSAPCPGSNSSLSKTPPIAALWAESARRMIGQLMAMRRIVEDILYLNHCVGNMQKEQVNLRELLQELAGNYGVQAEDKGVCVETEGDGTVRADREMLRIIVEVISRLKENPCTYALFNVCNLQPASHAPAVIYPSIACVKASIPVAAVNPSGVEAYKKSGADYLIAIGGGSSMDTAKAIFYITRTAPRTL